MSRTGSSVAKTPPPVALIGRLTPLETVSRQTTDGAALVSPNAISPRPAYDISGRIITSVHVREKAVALTFDDGPSRNLTKILKILNKYNSQATFFLVSDRIAKHTAWVNDIAMQGSEVGNHTATHLQLDVASSDQIAGELDKSQETIGQILGQKPTLMRPPVGKYNSQVVEAARSRKLAVALWSIHSQDTGDGSAAEIADRVISSASPGDIILMHETGANSLKALPLVLAGLRAKGYKFVTVSQLLSLGTLP
jgi:peptidoglycan/xylan/chitin deacetylase (PgdA/CDA1 family)